MPLDVNTSKYINIFLLFLSNSILFENRYRLHTLYVFLHVILKYENRKWSFLDIGALLIDYLHVYSSFL